MKSIVSVRNIVIVYGVNLAFVRYFVAVVDAGSFTAAAERCHVTQPTLSAGMARLEHEMGARLFDRGRRAALSGAGHRLRAARRLRGTRRGRAAVRRPRRAAARDPAIGRRGTLRARGARGPGGQPDAALAAAPRSRRRLDPRGRARAPGGARLARGAG